MFADGCEIMNKFENSRRKKIYEMVSIVKLLSILFCGIIVFSQYPTWNKANIQWYKYNALNTAVISMCVLGIMYQFWAFSYKKEKLDVKIHEIVEIILFMITFSVLILLSGGPRSQHKFLFLFIIITVTIEFGMMYGITIASMAAAFVLIVDLNGMIGSDVNIYFENDLILAGIFILTAWLLGYYVNIEKVYRQEMTELANRDELTGLYNHRFFQDALTEQLQRAQSKNIPVSLLLMDIDFFKYYNDIYGHEAGDRVLKRIGEILGNNTTNQDVAARYGGEEFAIILPNYTETQALSKAETIRKIVEQAPIQGEENLPNKKLTVSVGVSCVPERVKTKQDLIKSADDALYRAKFFQKNRVETYYSILEELKKDIDEEHIDLISSIKTLISVINAKDRYTYGHTERVVIYCDLMADHIGLSQMDKKVLKYSAYLHDIGKIQIPEEILNKKMSLTDEEWRLLKKHPVNGVEIIKPVEDLKDVVPLILHHHEQYDGKGYPEGLAGDAIPYLARILSVADSFDAMTSNRPYNRRKTYEEAVEELNRCSGSQFDPMITKIFIQMLNVNKDRFEKFYRQ